MDLLTTYTHHLQTVLLLMFTILNPYMLDQVEAGPNTSTVNLRVVGGDEVTEQECPKISAVQCSDIGYA
jgi:hypothetical protein